MAVSKNRKKKARKKKSRSLKKGLLLYAGFIMLSALLAFLFLILLVHSGLFGRLPGEETLSEVKHYTSTRVLSADGQVLGMYYLENRTNERIEDIPEDFINALISTEDVRFFQHKGIDNRSILRVMVRSVFLFDRDAGGGSTISQQLAKNLYPRKNFGPLTIPVAKIREAIIARRLERVYDKEDILELYLNTVSFGENTYGIATASMTFFDKSPAALKIEEAALLTGMLKANTSYNPRKNPAAALLRRNTVLYQMEKYGHLTLEEADSLAALPIRLKFKKINHIEGPAAYFREQVRLEAGRILDRINEEQGTDHHLYTDGLTVVTTLDLRLQEMAEKAVASHLKELQKLFERHWKDGKPWEADLTIAGTPIRQSTPYQYYKHSGLANDQIIDSLRAVKRRSEIYTPGGDIDTLISPLDSILHHLGILQAGMLVMDSRNGDVLAWVGGPSYKYFKYDHVLSKRQTGSTFKPVLYATALEQGLEPCQFFENDSITYTEFDDWTPANANMTYGGHYSLKGALINSVNTISVKILLETGIEAVIEQAREMGIQTELPEVPSLALGSAEIPLIEMTAAYCSFENGGLRVFPRSIVRIEDAQGNILYHDPGVPPERVLSESTAGLITSILEQVVDRGTAKSLRDSWGVKGPVAGKTGTTQDQTDGWFIGMVPGIVTGVWVGGEVPAVRFRTLGLGQGSAMALPVFARFASELHADRRFRDLANQEFDINRETANALDCEDFKEDTRFDLFDVFTRDQQSDEPGQSRRIRQSDEKDGTKVGKFLRKIFGGKKDKKQNRR